jgi:hypothetical protein
VTAPDPLEIPAELAALLGDDLFDATSTSGADAGWSRQAVELLTATRGPAEPDELAAEATIVAAMTEAIGPGAGGTPIRHRRGRVVRRVLAAKTTAAVVIALGITAAAAATGVAVTIVSPDGGRGPARDHRPVTTSAPLDDTHGGEPGGAGPFCQAAEALCPTTEPAAPPATDPDAQDTGRGSRAEPGARGNGKGKPAAHEDNAPTSKARPATPATPGPPADPGPPPGHGPPSDPGPPAGKGPPADAGRSNAGDHANAGQTSHQAL